MAGPVTKCRFLKQCAYNLIVSIIFFLWIDSSEAADAMTKAEKFPYDVAVISFFFGLLTFLISEFVKARLERRRVLDLLITDINYSWKHLDTIRHYPLISGGYGAYAFWDTHNINFEGTPHLNFEVYNLELLKTEGITLAKFLKRPAREKLWHIFQITKRAEDVRKYLVQQEASSVDYESYEKLFAHLVDQLADEILRLSEELYKEKYWGWNPSSSKGE